MKKEKVGFEEEGGIEEWGISIRVYEAAAAERETVGGWVCVK